LSGSRQTELLISKAVLNAWGNAWNAWGANLQNSFKEKCPQRKANMGQETYVQTLRASFAMGTLRKISFCKMFMMVEQ
jgi:hypothetical protein